MNAVQLIKGLKETRLRIFTTRDAMALAASRPEATVHLLRRLAQDRIVVRLKRGVWANLLAPALRAEEAVSHLTAPWPSYVSFYSALSEHGVISEIPSRIYAASSGRSRRIKTPLGTVDVHHLPARAIWGYEPRRSGEGCFPLATPEKAWLDTLYLASVPRSPIRMPVFRHRPSFDPKVIKEYRKRWPHPAFPEIQTGQNRASGERARR